MSGLFYNLGRRLGRAAIPAIRKTKWIYDGLAGSEEEAVRAEEHLGSSLAAELRAVTQPADDPALAALTTGLCQRLAPGFGDRLRTFRCEVIHDAAPNALALPGGFVFINDSLIEFCGRRPGELAFVVAHEMAHVVRRHAWDRMLNDAVMRVISNVGGRAGALGGWLRTSGIGLLQSAHSRDRELEADELGLRVMVAAGYPPDGAIALLEQIDRLGREPGVVSQYFASHPPASERIANLQRITRELK